jgi:nitroreductase
VVESVVYKIIKKRRSVREYAEKEIEKEKLDIILESARLAPSASNSQDWFFYVVKNREIKEKIASSEPMLVNQFLHKAPVLIVACERSFGVVRAATGAVLKVTGTRDRGWGEVDVTIALEHMVLTATELDIGSCWIGLFDGRRISRILDIPEDHNIVALLALGYSSSPSTNGSIGGIKNSSRLSLKDISKIV